MFKPYDFYGGELTFATAEEFLDYNLSEESKDYLRNLQYLSLHLPFKHHYDKDRTTKAIVEKANSMIKELSIDNVVVHHNNIIDISYLNQIHTQKCFENLTKKRGFVINDYRKVLKDNSGFKFVLDTTHALTFSMDHLHEIMDSLKDNIAQIHYSEFSEGRKHLPVHYNYYDLLPMLSKLDVPIILEVDYDNNDYESFIKDMDFIGLK